MAKPKLTLSTHFESYLLARDLSPAYINTIRAALAHFRRFVKHEPTIADLNSTTFNKWLVHMLEHVRVSKTSVYNCRRILLTLWRDLYDLELTDIPPRRIRPVRRRRGVTVAWSPDGVRRLLAEAEALSGRFQRSRVKRSSFFRAFVLVAWDSGLRLGDLQALQSATVRGKERFQVVQHKTGHPITIRLRPETLAAVEATYAPDGEPVRRYVFGKILGRSKVFRQFKKLATAAGLSTVHGTTRMLRRSSATAIEAAKPGTATRHLGHTSPDMARFYVDPKLVDADKPMVPPLIGPAGAEDEVSTPAPTVADVQGLLARMLAEATKAAEQPVEAKQAAQHGAPALGEGLPTLALLEEFLATAEAAQTGVSYRESTRSYIRSAIEECDFWRTGDLNGQRLVEFIRGRLAGGLSQHRASWARYTIARWLKWLVVAKGIGGPAVECLGFLVSATDLDAPKRPRRKAVRA